jgi:small subunit ribosomal protein S3Ae
MDLNCFPFCSFQIRQIRKKMVDIITREVTTSDLKDVVSKLIPDSMSLDIQVLK